jgi:hypothetical protein
MRTLRLSLAGTVILALLGGLSGAVAAQAEETASALPVAAVTGTVITQVFDDSDEEYSVNAAGVGHARGTHLVETYEYSDPRLPAEKRIELNFDIYPLRGWGDVWVLTSTIRLDGPDGYWTGTGQWFGPVGGKLASMDVYAGSQDVLVGHGAYEGLMAVLGCDGVTGCSGYIVKGEMPPMPDPVEPSAE